MSTEWFVVPLTPASEMITAGWDGHKKSYADNYGGHDTPEDTYAAMLAARPTGPDVPKLLTPRTEAEWREVFQHWWDGSGDCVNFNSQSVAFIAALRLVNAIKEDAT